MKASVLAFAILAFALPASGLHGSGAWGASGPSFDCAKAASGAEELVCTDPSLAALDRELADAYKQAVAAAAAGADKATALPLLRATQRGWIKGRDDCWKAADSLKPCVEQAYRDRIADLQAQWMLVPAGEPHFYRCDDNSEIVATFMQTDPSTARLERGDTTKIVLQGRSGSGARYLGDFGTEFWIKGREARVVWDQSQPPFTCRTRE